MSVGKGGAEGLGDHRDPCQFAALDGSDQAAEAVSVNADFVGGEDEVEALLRTGRVELAIDEWVY